MSVCGCACQLFGYGDLMEPCQDKTVTLTPHTDATSSPVTRLMRRNPAAVCSGEFERAGEEECCHSVSLSACWAYSARQASLEWAKKQMAGDSISHQCENRSAVAHPPELHQPPCHTHIHTHTSLPPPLLICCFKDLPEDIWWLIDVPPPCGYTAELFTGVSETPLCYSSTYLIGCGKPISMSYPAHMPFNMCCSTSVKEQRYNDRKQKTPLSKSFHGLFFFGSMYKVLKCCLETICIKHKSRHWISYGLIWLWQTCPSTTINLPQWENSTVYIFLINGNMVS